MCVCVCECYDMYVLIGNVFTSCIELLMFLLYFEVCVVLAYNYKNTRSRIYGVVAGLPVRRLLDSLQYMKHLHLN